MCPPYVSSQCVLRILSMLKRHFGQDSPFCFRRHDTTTRKCVLPMCPLYVSSQCVLPMCPLYVSSLCVLPMCPLMLLSTLPEMFNLKFLLAFPIIIFCQNYRNGSKVKYRIHSITTPTPNRPRV